MIAYLSGAVGNTPEMGSIWSEYVTKCLEDFGCTVINLVVESKKIIEKINWTNYKSWTYSNPQKFKNFIRNGIDRDLKLIIEKVDYLIVLWDDSVSKGGGNHGVTNMAYYKSIPIF